MGLTIHYSLNSKAKSADRAARLVEQMRQLALDLPFQRVDDHVRYLGSEVCQRPLDDLRGDDDIFSTVLDATLHSVTCPWGRKRHMSYSCQPLEVFSFWTVPGPGSEWAGIGLARYPAQLEVTYRPEDDDKFARTITDRGSTRWEFDWPKWRRWLERNGHNRWESPGDEKFHQRRTIKTGHGAGWRYSSFCKTQYASDPRCGGIPNFLRCHVGVITLLDRIAALPTMKVDVNDEGQYGPSTYSDDWREARAEGREPTYVWHPAKYDVRALTQEIGSWNEMIAAMSGALTDALEGTGIEGESAIGSFPNFEQLEFKGSQDARIEPFLAAMRNIADKNKDSGAA
jgi:hypothetical protein